jgi:hypothetical protein
MIGRGSAIESERRELVALKSLLIELKWQLALRRFARKYEGQPRDELGRFAEEDGTTDISAARRVSKIREARCLAQYALDTIVCTRAGSRACHAQAALRYSACLRGDKELPPLNY